MNKLATNGLSKRAAVNLQMNMMADAAATGYGQSMVPYKQPNTSVPKHIQSKQGPKSQYLRSRKIREMTPHVRGQTPQQQAALDAYANSASESTSNAPSAAFAEGYEASQQRRDGRPLTHPMPGLRYGQSRARWGK